MKRPIIGIGEVLYDVLPQGSKLGGAPANFAFHASQFGFDAVAISAVGRDVLGEQALDTFDKAGLKHIIPFVGYLTGTVNVSLNEAGVPTYEFAHNVAWDHIPFTDEMKSVAAEASAVCYGSLAQRSSETRDTIRQFLAATPADCLKIFDVNLRGDFYNEEIITTGANEADVLKINDEELVVLGRLLGYPGLDMEAKCRQLLNIFHLKMIILTCGTNGSYVFPKDGETSFMPTPQVKVADTVGAGDSFTGSFTAALLSGRTIAEAHALAVKVSAYVCTQKGAMAKLPQELTAI